MFCHGTNCILNHLKKDGERIKFIPTKETVFVNEQNKNLTQSQGSVLLELFQDESNSKD